MRGPFFSSTSSLPPLSSAATTTPAFRSRHRPGNLNVSINRRSALSAFFPSAGDLQPELDDNPAEAIISGEWTQNFSLLSYHDLLAYFRSLQPSAEKIVGSSTPLLELMATEIRMATEDQSVAEISDHFEFVSGLPVVDGELRCVGVVSKNDCAKATLGLNSKLGEIMSSPAITLTPENTVMDAAALMLRMKIHRIPILNKQKQVIGMVTRSDVCRALQGHDSD